MICSAPSGKLIACKTMNIQAWMRDGNADPKSKKTSNGKYKELSVAYARASASNSMIFSTKFLPGRNPRCREHASRPIVYFMLLLATAAIILLSVFLRPSGLVLSGERTMQDSSCSSSPFGMNTFSVTLKSISIRCPHRRKEQTSCRMGTEMSVDLAYAAKGMPSMPGPELETRRRKRRMLIEDGGAHEEKSNSDL